MAGLVRLPQRVASMPPRVAPAVKVALPFYKSAEWRALIAAIIAKRGRKCEAKGCGKRGFVIGDHITEIKDGGATLDARNIMLMCPACHGRKTQQRKRERLGLM